MLESKVVLAPGCEARASEPSGLSAPRRRWETTRCSCPSRRRRPAARSRLARRPSLSRSLSRTRLVPAPPQSVFLRVTQPLHQPPYGGVAKGRAGYVLQKAASLSDGGGRTFLYIPFEEELAFLAYLVGPSGALSGLERPPFSGGSRVALDRGEAHVEEAGRLSFWHAPLYGANYLLAEIFRVGSHPIMIACGSIFMLTAVGGRQREVRRMLLPRNSANRDRSGPPYRRLLSLLVSILSSTSSKNPVPMRAPPEKGCSKAPTVNNTSPMTAARVTTISLCAHVLARPNRYVKPTVAIAPKIRTAQRTAGTPSSEATRRILLASARVPTCSSPLA